MNLTFPYKFTPRPYQLSVFKAIDSGIKRAVCVWHRRAGKDKTLINLLTKQAVQRKGIYYYLYPTGTWGRRALWYGLDKDGFPFLGHIPEEIRARMREDEMRIELKNGSSIQIIGTDRLELVGPNPVGCVFSEYSLQSPHAWEYIRPILAENEGWAVFNYTPRGRNHGWDLYSMAKDNPDWFCELLTVDDTGAISQEAIEAERKAGMSDELIKQEFFCFFDYGLEGAFYLKQLSEARKEGRICRVPVEKLPVHTAWDLGRKDATAIWFFQLVGLEVHLVDYYENSGEELEHYAKVLQDKGYLYGEHYAPHDAAAKRLSGPSVEERGAELGLDFIVMEQERDIFAGIEIARSIFPRCWFDEQRTKAGLNALMNYQKEYDEKHKVFKTRPLHDWSSNGADAFRYMARAVKLYHTGGHMSQADIDRMYNDYAIPVTM